MAEDRSTPDDGHSLKEKLANIEYRAIFQQQFPAKAFRLPGLEIVCREHQKIG